MEKPTALVLGATGLTGGLLLRRLLAEDRYKKIIAPCRRELSGFAGNPVLEPVEMDFDDMEEKREVFSADHLFIALGTTMKKARTKEFFRKVDYTYALTAARLCLRNGAQKLLLISAGGANTKSRIYYSQVKGDLEEALISLHYPSLCILRPSLILGDRAEDRPGEEFAKFLARNFAFLIPKRYKAVEAGAIADALAALAARELPGVNIFESEEIGALAG